MSTFEETIQAHLIECAATDEEFAIKLDAGMNGKKPISKCCEYIMAEMRKKAKGRGAIAVEDNEVFGLAKHFYIEDNIVIPTLRPNASVSVGDKKAEAISKAAEEYKPTEEDLAKARQIAIARELARRHEDELKKAAEKKDKAKEEAKGQQQLTIFDVM